MSCVVDIDLEVGLQPHLICDLYMLNKDIFANSHNIGCNTTNQFKTALSM